MNYQTKVFNQSFQKKKLVPQNVIFSDQTHSSQIKEIKTGEENLVNCDGMFTSNKNNFLLGMRVADCAAISFCDDEKYGIIHVGWRGLTKGIVEKMSKNFTNPKVFVAPLLTTFEIQKDDCYYKINNYFGDKFFSINNKKKIIFQFQQAIANLLPKETIFDLRNTFNDKNLASCRRDKSDERNIIIIAKTF